MRTIALASAGVVFARATSTTAAAMILPVVVVVVVVVAGFGCWFVNVIDDAFCILFDALTTRRNCPLPAQHSTDGFGAYFFGVVLFTLHATVISGSFL